MNLGMLKLLGEPPLASLLIAASSAAVKETRKPASRIGHGIWIVVGLQKIAIPEVWFGFHCPRSVVLPGTGETGPTRVRAAVGVENGGVMQTN
jgi:hypothetical protein